MEIPLFVDPVFELKLKLAKFLANGGTVGECVEVYGVDKARWVKGLLRYDGRFCDMVERALYRRQMRVLSYIG